MSLYKRNGTWYYDFIVNGRRFNKTTATTDKRKAQAIERDAMLKCHDIPKNNLTLTQAIARGDLDRWRHRKDGEQTIARLQRIADFLGDVSLVDLDRPRIANIRDWLERTGASVATVNRYMAALKTLLNMAYKEWGVLDKVPYVKLQPENPEERRALTAREIHTIRRFLVDVGQDDVADLVKFLVDTGLRLGEALKLTDVDIRDGCVYLVDTKAGRPRTVPLTGSAQAIVEGRQGRLFRYGKWYYARHFKEAVLRSGVDPKGVVLHSLRHTCCTRLVERGAGLEGAGAILGHSTATMTSRYSHLSTEHLRKTVKLLEG